MINREWFKRQVEIIAQAVGAVLGLKQKGDIQAAIEQAESTIKKVCGMNAKLALGLDVKDAVSLACRGEEPTPEFLNSLAELFGEWASLLASQGRAVEADAARARAQALRASAGERQQPGLD